MTREEAINKVRQMSLPKETMEILEALAPELAESEGERIRKRLLWFLANYTGKWDYPETRMACRAWLEKQKEQEPIKWTDLTWKDIVELEGIINNVHYEFRNGIGQESFGKEVLEKFREYKGDEYLDEKEQKPVDDSDFKTKLAEYMMKNRTGYSYSISSESILEMAKEELIKRGELKEQKPAEWDEYTETNLDRALMIIKSARGKLQGYQSDDGIYECDKAIECIEHILYRGINIEKPAEWSEEDKEMLLSIINAFRNGTVSTIGQEQWLKSLPKRFNLQPKQEWSEEDEEMLDIVLTMVDCSTVVPHSGGQLHPSESYKKDISEWLKSLRPS